MRRTFMLRVVLLAGIKKISTIKMVFTCLESMYNTLYPVSKHCNRNLWMLHWTATQLMSHYEYAPTGPLECFLLKRQIDTPVCFHKSRSIVKSWRPFCIPNHECILMDLWMHNIGHLTTKQHNSTIPSFPTNIFSCLFVQLYVLLLLEELSWPGG